MINELPMQLSVSGGKRRPSSALQGKFSGYGSVSDKQCRRSTVVMTPKMAMELNSQDGDVGETLIKPNLEIQYFVEKPEDMPGDRFLYFCQLLDQHESCLNISVVGVLGLCQLILQNLLDLLEVSSCLESFLPFVLLSLNLSWDDTSPLFYYMHTFLHMVLLCQSDPRSDMLGHVACPDLVVPHPLTHLPVEVIRTTGGKYPLCSCRVSMSSEKCLDVSKPSYFKSLLVKTDTIGFVRTPRARECRFPPVSREMCTLVNQLI
ncbi:hypothetical protein E2542_SST22955 [Spatholobus suberectus]|nr:hypothetical protein E2542_SST22955 [Spatholobus suberectus]